MATPEINSFSPLNGKAGALVEIEGDNFTGVTQVKFGGSGGELAAFLSVNANLIRAHVPPDSQSGKIYINHPDSDIESNADFIVKTPTLPENTPRGREALERISLAEWAKSKNDLIALTKYWNTRVAMVVDGEDEVLTAPPTTDISGSNAFRNKLKNATPTGFVFDSMQMLGSAGVVVNGHDATKSYTYGLTPTSAGYKISSANVTTL
jgi:hypothetical protein